MVANSAVKKASIFRIFKKVNFACSSCVLHSKFDWGGKGWGKGSSKQHPRLFRDNIQGITTLAIRTLIRRGGVKPIETYIWPNLQRSQRSNFIFFVCPNPAFFFSRVYMIVKSSGPSVYIFLYFSYIFRLRYLSFWLILVLMLNSLFHILRNY